VHPILARPERRTLYLTVWGLAAVALVVVLARLAPTGWPAAIVMAVPVAGFTGSVCLAALYVCRAFPLRGGSSVRTVFVIAVASALSAGLSVGFSYFAVEGAAALVRNAGMAAPFRALAPWLFGLAAVAFAGACLLSYLLIEFEQSQAIEERALRLQIHAAQAELRALRAQIDPHFLFNSLNSIGALIGTEPSTARRMCLLLADFLRSSLRVPADGLPLADEMRLVEQYLAIEKVRFGPRLEVAIGLGDEVRDVRVPPLILQPLVENAITHGIAGLIEGGTIRLTAEARGGTARIRVENPREPGSRRAGAGVGLANVRARLQAEFGREAWLAVDQDERSFTAVVALPMPVGSRAGRHDAAALAAAVGEGT
jgi:hypothetical protein